MEDLWIYALCVFWGHVGLLSGGEWGEINGGKSAVNGGEVGRKRGVKLLSV